MAKKRKLQKKPHVKSNLTENQFILSALGVMGDEICGPVPTDELNFCLRVDFKVKMKDEKLLSLLNQALNSNQVEKLQNNWQLTSEGAIIADNILEKFYQ